MGLTFVVAFWIFGLTVETFDLKMTASFCASVVAILAAASAYADRRGSDHRDAPREPHQ
jgi:O-antigen ligase